MKRLLHKLKSRTRRQRSDPITTAKKSVPTFIKGLPGYMRKE